jgi:hypothetical protein
MIYTTSSVIFDHIQVGPWMGQVRLTFGIVFCRSFRHVGIVLRHGSWQNIVVPGQLRHKIDCFNVAEFFLRMRPFT